MSNLPKFTQEQLAANLEKARQAREAKRIEREANKHLLKLNYLDSNNWATLATKYKIRMPSNEEAVDLTCLRKYLKRTGISYETWNEHYTSINYFVKNNPKWTKCI